ITTSGMLKRVTVGVDVPSHIYANVYQSNSERAVRLIEYSLLGANLVYMRQVGIRHQLNRVVLRTDAGQDPYAPLRAPDGSCTVDTHCKFLTEVARQWNTVLPAGTEHMALVLREVDGAGLASVGTVASPRSYSSNDLSAAGDFSTVWRHEGGHNWSLSHFDGGTPEGSTINSGNSLAKMSGPEAALVGIFRAGKNSSFTEIGPLSLPIPPDAATDSYLVPVSLPSMDLDVLANDHDANGGSLTLNSVNTVSGSLGGTVSVVNGKIRYQPQNQLTTGFNVLQYQIAGTSGTARGFVFVTQVNFGRSYQQNFNAFANGVTDLGDGSVMTQINSQPSVSVQDSALELVPDQTNRVGGFSVPMIGLEFGFRAKFRWRASSAGTPADAFAFNFGQRVASASKPDYHGFMRGVTVEFNTFASPGYQLFVNGVAVPGAFVSSNSIADGVWHDAEISWGNGKLTLKVDNATVFDQVSTTGFTPSFQDGLAFSAQNRGLSQRVLIDDIDIGSTGVFQNGFE
ncbi:MAG: hypothetical protein KDI69_03450, partial [Xanthomonadales bacterium]|nr:hypothetical protein [Xanthomonadales bacterium]